MSDSVSFKVYLKNQGEEEVRRFVIDKNVSTSYDYLVEKLKTLFPQLQGTIISISWTDGDGDNVTIASDDELIIALTEMTGPLYKINVSVKQAASVHVDMSGDHVSDQGAEPGVHYGVTCDGCDMKPISGNRYKCVVCDDFDLCEACETAGKHPGHNKMKIIQPGYIFPQRLFKRMQTLQNRASKKMKKEEEKEEEARAPRHPVHPPCRGMGPRGRGMFGGPRFGGRGGLMGFTGPLRPGGPFSFEPLDSMMKGWTGTQVYNTEAANKAAEEAHKAANKAAEEAHNAAHQTAHAAAHAAATAGLSGLAAMNQAFRDMNMNGSDEYLKNIGNLVAAYLDPMGIDVKIDIETPDGTKTNVSSSTKTTTESKTEETPSKEEEKKDEAAAPVNDEVMEVEPEPTKKAATPSDDEDWTVVNDKKEVEENQAAALYPDLSGASAVNEASTAVNEAAATEATTTEATAPTEAAVTHPDPRIQVALQAMMNMGFTNDGGWLTSLLEAKNGDIGKVLDILQPVKK